MPQGDWSDGMAQQIGQRLRRYRDARGLSAQKVADACTALGVPIDRNVLASLENRRRNIVTVAEVIAFARVLGIPPLALIYPVGDDEPIEAFPGIQTDAFTAARWFAGETALPGDAELSIDAAPNVLALYRSHARLVDELLQQIEATRRTLNDSASTPGEIKAAQDATRARAEALEIERSLIRYLGVRMPLLPDAIGGVIN